MVVVVALWLFSQTQAQAQLSVVGREQSSLYGLFFLLFFALFFCKQVVYHASSGLLWNCSRPFPFLLLLMLLMSSFLFLFCFLSVCLQLFFLLLLLLTLKWLIFTFFAWCIQSFTRLLSFIITSDYCAVVVPVRQFLFVCFSVCSANIEMTSEVRQSVSLWLLYYEIFLAQLKWNQLRSTVFAR